MDRLELLNKILKKVIYRYNKYNLARCWGYIGYTISYYNLHFEEYNYIYKNFNKYIKKNPKNYDLEKFSCRINGEYVKI